MNTVRSYDWPPYVYAYKPPEGHPGPILFASPHSGAHYRPDFLDQTSLSLALLRRSEDAFVDELFSSVPALGAGLLSAQFPRTYVDVNRSAGEWDPKLFRHMPDDALGFELQFTPRANMGLGVIPRIAAEGRGIYRARLGVDEGLSRLRNFYHPYHDKVKTELDRLYAAFGQSILIDCHSMPISSANGVDIVLGDYHGQACAPSIVATAEVLFRKLGFTTRRNSPYAGGYSTVHYGAPEKGRHALQIEINRGLYMNERVVTRNQSFDQVQEKLSEWCTEFIGAMWAYEKAAE